MSLDTYDGLKTTIIEWLDRDDLTQYVDTLIDLAEDRFRREIRLNSLLTETPLTISQDSNTASVPGDFLDIRYMRLQIPDATIGRTYYPTFRQVTQHELSELARNDPGTPAFWTLEGSTFQFDRDADRDYTADLFYYKTMTPLSGTAASNELLAEHPSAYLYASLAESAPFLMHDERIATWEALYSNIRDRIRTSELGNKRGGPLVGRVRNIPHKYVRH